MENLYREIQSLCVVPRAQSQDSGHFIIQHEEWGSPFGTFTTVLDNRTKEVMVVLGIITAPSEAMVSKIIEAHVRPTIQDMYGKDALYKVEAFTECLPSVVYQPKKPSEKIAYSIKPIPPRECCLASDETDNSRWQYFLVRRAKGAFRQEIGILANHYEITAEGGPLLTSYLTLKDDILVGKDQLHVLARELQSYTSNRFVKGNLCGNGTEHRGTVRILRGTCRIQGKLIGVCSCDAVERAPKYKLLVM